MCQEILVNWAQRNVTKSVDDAKNLLILTKFVLEYLTSQGSGDAYKFLFIYLQTFNTFLQNKLQKG